ncbi:hypothetical protein HYG81_21965 (plasmid) [Natrinema zhouii]|uniref:hypothetical protein n=1 Tax=Natrinema zhouii TaxID=1710539 RepID=UPI001CFF5AA1|nr:hypothetical protein [Natrinema zhouii]UHQ98642.1 hypothetical protein HYG81_21965 [Natrinema zhouii]
MIEYVATLEGAAFGTKSPARHRARRARQQPFPTAARAPRLRTPPASALRQSRTVLASSDADGVRHSSNGGSCSSVIPSGSKGLLIAIEEYVADSNYIE